MIFLYQLYTIMSSSCCSFTYFVAWLQLNNLSHNVVLYALLKMKIMLCNLLFVENHFLLLQLCLLCFTIFAMSCHCLHLFEILKLHAYVNTLMLWCLPWFERWTIAMLMFPYSCLLYVQCVFSVNDGCLFMLNFSELFSVDI